MMMHLWLAGIVGLMCSWDEGMCLGCPDSADLAGARSWVQDDGCSYLVGMLTRARLCAIHQGSGGNVMTGSC